MWGAPFKVVLDANVIYPLTLRDTLLRAAEEEFYQLYWSQEILDEAKRNLIDDKMMTEAQAARMFKAMTDIFPEAMVTNYEGLIASMQNDPKDRHVAAAAVRAGAQVIVTDNLKDFLFIPEGIEAQSPDEFLSNLFDLDPERFTDLLRDQAAEMKKPPVTFEQLIGRLEKVAPDLVKQVRAHIAGSPN